MISAEEIARVVKLSKQQIISIGVAAGFRGSPKFFGEDAMIVFKLCELFSMSGFNDNDLCAIARHASDRLRPDLYKRQIVSIIDMRYVTIVTGGNAAEIDALGLTAEVFNFKEWEMVTTIPTPLVCLTVTVAPLAQLAREANVQLLRLRAEEEAKKSPPPAGPTSSERTDPPQ